MSPHAISRCFALAPKFLFVSLISMSNIPSMQDIAKRVGVHRSTVSLALRNSPRVLDSTKQKVLSVAKELGYVPNPYISVLMRNRRKGKPPPIMPSIALITSFPTRDGCVEEFPLVKPAIAAAKRQAESRGFKLEEVWAPLDKMDPARLSNILLTRGISGILLTPFPRPVWNYDIEWKRLAVVSWGMSLRKNRVHHVRSNHFSGMTMAMDECWRLGYRRIGLAMREEANTRVDDHWEAAYLLKLRQFGLTDVPSPLFTKDWSKDVLIDWYRRGSPDVIISYTRKERALQWLRSDGIRIPEDVGMVSLSCAPDGELSGVIENWSLQAIRGVNLVIDLLADNVLGLHDYPNISMVDSTWNPGTTLRPINSEEEVD